MELSFSPLPPLKERLSRAVSYWTLAASGIWLVVLPPDSVANTIGSITLFVWAAMMLPGLVAGLSILRGKVIEEYVSLCFIAGGVAFYACFLWFTVPTVPSRGFVALLATALLSKLISRFLTLHRQVRDWRKSREQ